MPSTVTPPTSRRTATARGNAAPPPVPRPPPAEGVVTSVPVPATEELDEVDGELLSLDEATSIVMLTIGGGVDTTTALTSAALVHLGRHDDDRKRLIADPSLIDSATEDEIQKAPDHQAGDPLLDARGTRRYVGNISEMTLWRWSQEFDFPAPDVVIGRRRFWRRSTLDNWIESRRQAA